MRIYVSGPLTDSSTEVVVTNIYKALDASIEILKRGHSPFIPHLAYFLNDYMIRSRKISTASHDAWLSLFDFPWLDVCDGLLFMGSSPGADEELKRAENLGKIIWTDISDIPHVTPSFNIS